MLRTRFDACYADDRHTAATAALAYIKHLETLDPVRDRELLLYFATDFFHDGPIEGLAFDPGRRTLSWRIAATWIEPREASEGPRAAPLMAYFHCTFHDVVWFASTCERVDGANDPLAEPRDATRRKVATSPQDTAGPTTATITGSPG